MKIYQKMIKNPKGSMLVPVLIIMLMVSAMSIAIIGRSKHGAILTTDTKQGYLAYENSDQDIEKFLSDMKEFDNDPIKIPENVGISSSGGSSVICSQLGQDGFKCYKDNTNIINLATGRVSDIFKITKTSTTENNSDTARSINASVPERVQNPVDGSTIKVEQPGPNRCDFRISWSASNDAEVDALVLRRSTNSSLKEQWKAGDYGWRVAGAGADSISVGNGNFTMKNGDGNINQYGGRYFFAMKATNKDPLKWDSLYVQNNSGNNNSYAQMEDDADCDNSKSLTGLTDHTGCLPSSISTTIPGIKPMSGSGVYNCCNNTECFVPDTDWLRDSAKECALQQCKAGDEVVANPAGTSTTGYCGTVESCKPGADCDKPYKTLGHCLAPPGASTQSSFFNASSWSLSGNADVYEDPLSSEMKNRCANHNCPSGVNQNCGAPPGGYGVFTASLASCTSPLCGPYTASVLCSLSCDGGFYPAESRASSTSQQVTVSYSGNCCYQNCPPDTRTKECRSGSCNGVCGGFSDTRQQWDMPTCSNPVCECGLASSCSCDCNGCTPGVCNAKPSCPAPPSCACGSNWSCTQTCGGPIVSGGCLACPPPVPRP